MPCIRRQTHVRQVCCCGPSAVAASPAVVDRHTSVRFCCCGPSAVAASPGGGVVGALLLRCASVSSPSAAGVRGACVFIVGALPSAAKRPSAAFDVSVTRFCSCVFFKWQWLVHKLVVTHWRGLKKPLLIRRTLNSTPETMHASFRNAFTAAVNHGPAPGMQLRAKPFQTSTTSGAERF